MRFNLYTYVHNFIHISWSHTVSQCRLKLWSKNTIVQKYVYNHWQWVSSQHKTCNTWFRLHYSSLHPVKNVQVLSYSCCNDICCATFLAIHEYEKNILGVAYARTQQWRACPCCLCCVLPHPNNCDVPHTVKMSERRSANGLTGKYLSRWYGLFTDVQPELWQQCEHRLLQDQALSYVSYTGVSASESLQWWGAMAKVSKRMLISSVRPCQPWKYVCCWKITASIFSFLFKKPLFQSRFVIGVLPSPTLVHVSFPCRSCVRAFMIFSSG